MKVLQAFPIQYKLNNQVLLKTLLLNTFNTVLEVLKCMLFSSEHAHCYICKKRMSVYKPLLFAFMVGCHGFHSSLVIILWLHLSFLSLRAESLLHYSILTVLLFHGTILSNYTKSNTETWHSV